MAPTAATMRHRSRRATSTVSLAFTVISLERMHILGREPSGAANPSTPPSEEDSVGT